MPIQRSEGQRMVFRLPNEMSGVGEESDSTDRKNGRCL